MVVEAEQNTKCTALCMIAMQYYWLILNLSLSGILGVCREMCGSAKRKEEKQVQPQKLARKVLPSHLSKETGSFTDNLLEVHKQKFDKHRGMQQVTRTDTSLAGGQ